MPVVSLAEAKERLSELLVRASEGEEIVISRNGRPTARLVTLQPTRVRRSGCWRGRVAHASDYDTADSALQGLFLDPLGER